MADRETEAALEVAQTENKLYKIRDKAKTYPEVSAEQKKASIGSAIRQQMQAMKRGKDRVDLRDASAVEDRIEEYLESCTQYGAVPTFLSLATYMGYSRSNLYAYMYHHEDTESARALDRFRSLSAGIIAQASLSRTLDNATSIFLLKNCGQGLNDKTELELTRGVDPAPKTRAQDIVDKWQSAGIDLPAD